MECTEASLAGTRNVTLGARKILNLTQTPKSLREKLTATFNERDILDINRFIEVSGSCLGYLKAEGEKVKEHGYIENRALHSYKITSESHFPVMRSLKDGWDKIDGTVAFTLTDQLYRYQIGIPCLSDDQSGLCACVFVAMRLDIGRLQCDQLTARASQEFRRQYSTAGLMQDLINQIWFVPSENTRIKKCNEIFRALQRTLQLQFPLQEKLSIGLIACWCFQAIPQMTFSVLCPEMCCDGVRRFTRNETYMAASWFHLEQPLYKASIQHQIIKWLATTDSVQRPLIRPCSRGEQCTDSVKKISVVLDDLPPTLMVILEGKTFYHDPEARHVFDNLQLAYLKDQVVVVNYRPVGAIFQEQDNYVVRWRADRERDPKSSFLQF